MLRRLHCVYNHIPAFGKCHFGFTKLPSPDFFLFLIGMLLQHVQHGHVLARCSHRRTQDRCMTLPVHIRSICRMGVRRWIWLLALQRTCTTCFNVKWNITMTMINEDGGRP